MTYYLKPKVTEWQRQVIIGTLMGGSTIMKPSTGNNCYLSMRGKNGKWLQCKAQEIGFIPPNPFYLENNKYFRWHSSCSPVFNDFYELFYENGKKVAKMDVLDSLRAIGLAIWFLDSAIVKKEVMKLNVKSFCEDSRSVINEYFKLIDLNGELINTKIVMDKKSTSKFIQIIGDYIPEFLLG